VTFGSGAEDVLEGNCAQDVGVVEGLRTDLGSSTCKMVYSPGDAVTLRAEGGPQLDPPDTEAGPATTFIAWSDDRCPPAPQDCTIILEPGAQSVAAIFSPQRVAWWAIGAGTVTADVGAPSFDCPDAGPPDCEARDYPFGTPVNLTATANDPTTTSTEWLNKVDQPGRTQTLCDEVVSTTCRVSAIRPRWAVAIFGGADFIENVPPEVSVDFRIRKAGGGSGTVRSQSIDCGTRCNTPLKFGDPETLEAAPDTGSRFDHWGAACGTAPRCSLAVGPVTAVTAFFERAGSGGAQQQQQQQSTRPRLSARVLRLKVTGHGRKRIIFVRLRVNAASTVRAVLLRGRKRVASKSFRVKAGTPLVRFRVPARVRKGTYRLRLTIKGNGQTRQLTRRVRLPR
jgi:hypothetical protein